ncbi:hypothetical protein [Rubrivirga sp. IMCC43871]|uniref:hypothetical protein n=1 Tax=Rubrivirga sp. IMCC43871 TaxID=3391575 RepID=UPI003990327B
MARPIPTHPVLRALGVARISLSATAASHRERDLFAGARTYVSFIDHDSPHASRHQVTWREGPYRRVDALRARPTFLEGATVDA